MGKYFPIIVSLSARRLHYHNETRGGSFCCARAPELARRRRSYLLAATGASVTGLARPAGRRNQSIYLSRRGAHCFAAVCAIVYCDRSRCITSASLRRRRPPIAPRRRRISHATRQKSSSSRVSSPERLAARQEFTWPPENQQVLPPASSFIAFILANRLAGAAQPLPPPPLPSA